RDLPQLRDRALQELLILERVADPHVDHDLLEARRLHHARVLELLHQRRAHGLGVERRQSRLAFRRARATRLSGRRGCGFLAAGRLLFFALGLRLGAFALGLGGFALGLGALTLGFRALALRLLFVCHRSRSPGSLLRGAPDPGARAPRLDGTLGALGLRQRLAAHPRHALAGPVRHDADADARSALGLGVVQLHVRQMDGSLALQDPALNALAARLRVTLDEIHFLHDDPHLHVVDRQHAADLALVVAGDHLNGVTLANPDRHQITSGANEMIFMNAFSRSSRATGPKMRVPRGSLSSLIRTTAFSSKRMYEPSLRRPSLTARTTTALATSPFFTPAPGIAS